MVGSSVGKMIVKSAKWPYGVWWKGVQTNSVQCTACKKVDSQVVYVVTCRWLLMVSGVINVLGQSKKLTRMGT